MPHRRPQATKHHHKHHTSSAMVVRRPEPPRHTTARPIVIRHVSPPKPKKHHRKAKSGGGGGFGGLGSEKHRLGAIAGGAVFALVEHSGVKVPEIAAIGKAGTIGAAAWVAAKYLHMAWAEDLATGMLSIAAYEFVQKHQKEAAPAKTTSGVEGYDYMEGSL